MIATVVVEDKPTSNARPCIVRWTGSKRLLKVVVQTYCEKEVDAGDYGVLQLPDKVLHKNLLCPQCTAVYRAYESSL